jgi:uncharacterized protein (UPF0335 family)
MENEENEKYLTFSQAKEIVRELAKSQGFYCRLLKTLEWIEENDKEQLEILEEDFAFNKVKTELDLIFYFEV